VKLSLSGKKEKSQGIVIKQKDKPKKKKMKKRASANSFAYRYSIIPTNFINLSEEAQVQRLGQFFDILNVIDDKIKITMSRRIVPITVEEQIQNMPVMQLKTSTREYSCDYSCFFKTD